MVFHEVMDQLLKLSLATQIALGSGYVAYCAAYLGIRSHHKAIDVTLSTLGFSLIATLIMSPAPDGFLTLKQPALGIVSALITIFCGLAWRGFGREIIARILRSADISWVDDLPSALSTITTQEKYNITQVSVHLDDDSWLHCVNASWFNESPFGPCSIGETGDLGIYATHRTLPDGTYVEVHDVKHNTFGDQISYIPAARIKRIEFRYSKRTWRFSPFWAKPKAYIAAPSALAESKPAASEPEL